MSEPQSITQARERVLAAVRPLELEAVPVGDALGRVLGEDILVATEVPPFDNSAMDGFAVCTGDGPGERAIAGESRAGAPALSPLAPGTAMRISTGAPMPEGADAVVPVEQTSEHGGRLRLHESPRAGQHLRRAGEDMRAGQRALARGARLGPAELGVAVAAGAGRLSCTRVPRVAIVATGDELVAPGLTPGPGQIPNSNAVTLAALARQAGATVVAATAAPDEAAATRAALARALQEADMVIVSGGVSVGSHDHVKGALLGLGVAEAFWRVALRPGGPTWFGTRGRTLVFGLPGNPASAMVTFTLFAAPALAALQGAPPEAPRRRARLTQALARHPRRTEAVRVVLAQRGTELLATPTGAQGSHRLSSMLGAQALALIEAGEGSVAEGAEVELVWI
ncbi:MAG TPA: gephyrin-like molybdotransferase Glp [Solirubrobacteraceae bacterium]|nr:gephyrin-like molybdotransferase Glp [Solirubrobacteraceae bacterium]